MCKYNQKPMNTCCVCVYFGRWMYKFKQHELTLTLVPNVHDPHISHHTLEYRYADMQNEDETHNSNNLGGGLMSGLSKSQTHAVHNDSAVLTKPYCSPSNFSLFFYKIPNVSLYSNITFLIFLFPPVDNQVHILNKCQRLKATDTIW